MTKTKTPANKYDETAKLALAFAAALPIQDVAKLLQLDESETRDLIVRGRYLAAVAMVEGRGD